MTIRVTMTQTRMGESGSLLAAGNTYTVSREFGAWLVGWRYATDVDGVLNEPSEDVERFAVTATRLAELVADSALVVNAVYVVGSTWYRATSSSSYTEVGGGTVDIASMTAAATAGTAQEKSDFLDAAGASQYLAPATEAANFTLTSASHANRRVDCTKGSAQAVSWASGHGMADGDSGRLMQVGAGAITITKDGGFSGGELKLATGVASATTVNDGDVLDWEYDATGERLLITYRSAASAGGTLKSTPYSDGNGTQAFTPGNTTEFTLSSITIPANKIGANGWVQFIASAERTAGAGNITCRIRVANATTGTQIATPPAGSRVTFEGLMASLSSTSSHRSGSPGVSTIGGTGVTVTDTTASTADITFYLTGQLATGTDTLTRYYFKAIVHNPDA